MALTFVVMLLWPSAMRAQTPVDRHPKALVGSWVARTIVKGLEEEILMLTLAPDSSATMLMTSAEEHASGKKPDVGVLRWWVDYPAWPDRAGRQLCLKSRIPFPDGTIPKARCQSYTILGARPKLRLVYDERTWEWVKVNQARPAQPSAGSRSGKRKSPK